MSRTLFIMVTAMLLLIFNASLASASADLMVGPGTITASPAINPGQTIKLPTHEITNNSFRALEMAISVSNRSDDELILPPADWFSITPNELIVQARSSGEVQVELVLPHDALPGEYKVWFLFDSMPIGASSGMVTAAAINVSFTFEVADVGQTSEDDKDVVDSSDENVTDQLGDIEEGETEEPEDTDADEKTAEDELSGNVDAEESKSEANATEKDERNDQEGIAAPDENSPIRGRLSIPWTGAGVLLVILVLGGGYLRRRFQD